MPCFYKMGTAVISNHIRQKGETAFASGLLLHLVALAAEAGNNFLDMGLVAGLQRQLHHAGADGGAGVAALMVHVQHVGTQRGYHLQERRQRVGLVGQDGGERHSAALLGKAAGEDALQHGHVHIAAGQQGTDGLALDAGLVIHGGGDANRARALGHQLLLFQHRQDGAGDLAFRYRHHLVHVLAAHVEGQVAGSLDLDAVGDGVHAGKRDNLAFFQRFRHAGGAGGLDTDDAAGGLQVLRGVGEAADETAAADGHEDRVHVRQLL